MLMQRLAIATASFAAIACGGGPLLSPPGTWSDDFTSRSPPTEDCPGGSLARLGTRMAVSEPYTLEAFPSRVPDPIRSRISKSDRLLSFQFSHAPVSGDYWGFSGYLVARGDCIVHAQVTGYDN